MIKTSQQNIALLLTETLLFAIIFVSQLFILVQPLVTKSVWTFCCGSITSIGASRTAVERRPRSLLSSSQSETYLIRIELKHNSMSTHQSNVPPDVAKSSVNGWTREARGIVGRRKTTGLPPWFVCSYLVIETWVLGKFSEEFEKAAKPYMYTV